MQRLIASALLLTTVLTPLRAQQEQQPKFHWYSICGDVAAPQAYQWNSDRTVYVQDLIATSRSQAIAGLAIVLRGPEFELAAVEQVFPSHPYQGAPLQNGDMIVFQSDPATPRTPGNAMVMMKSVPDVLPLPPTGVSVAQLFQGLKLAAPAQVRVIRCQSGDPSSVILSPDSNIVHGDIVLLNEALRSAGIAAAQLALKYSRQPLGHAAASGTNDLPPEIATTEPEPSIADAALFPVVTIPGGDYSDETSSSAKGKTDPFAGLTEEQQVVGSEFLSGQMELRTSDAKPSRDEVATVSPMQTVSLANQFPSDLDASAPAEPQASATATGGGRSIWNGIFIGGLLFAIGLITVGWLKTQKEQEIEARMQESLRESLSSDGTVGQVTVSTPVQQSHLPANSEAVDDDTATLSASKNNESTAAATCESSGEALNETMEFATDDHADRHGTDSTERLPTQVTFAEANWFADSDTEPSSDVHAQPPSRSAVTQESNHPTIGQPSTSDIDRVNSTQEQSAEPWSDLEDLIQNRLPMELTEVELPLRINLFGRPAGPKRLRIDAAHTEIAAPHMVRKGAQGRTKQTVSGQPKSAPRKRQESDSSSDRRSGLDKALNYLEEQAES